MTGLRLYGVAAYDGEGPFGPPEVRLLSVRELAAVVCDAPYAKGSSDQAGLEEYRGVIESVFRQHTILPAPYGTIFKSGDHLTRWLDRNYVTLSEGVHFLDGRCEARVHMSADAGRRADGHETALTAAAADAFRTLRRGVAAALPLRCAPDTRRVFSAAFLLERTRWDEFSEVVREQTGRYGELEFEQTGPWPPYDFIRMEFGV